MKRVFALIALALATVGYGQEEHHTTAPPAPAQTAPPAPQHAAPSPPAAHAVPRSAPPPSQRVAPRPPPRTHAYTPGANANAPRPPHYHDHGNGTQRQPTDQHRHWSGGGHVDRDHWRHGHWWHGRSGGRNGWWWIVGPEFYWYGYQPPAEPYPEQYADEPDEDGGAPAADPYTPPREEPRYWYWCEEYGAYYPDVDSCPSGWDVEEPQE